MKSQQVWVFVCLLLAIGMIGCGGEDPVAEKPKAAAEQPEQPKAAEEQPEVAEKPEPLTKEQAIAEIKKLGGRVGESSFTDPSGRVLSEGLLIILPSSVTDADLRYMRALTNTQTLSIDGTEVTDAGLEHLKGLTQLLVLLLRNTQVTDAGVNNLRKSLPKAKIDVTRSPQPLKPETSKPEPPTTESPPAKAPTTDAAEPEARSAEPKPTEPPKPKPPKPEPPAAEPTPKAEPAYRTWTDSTGQFKVEATFRGVLAGKVKLLKKDGLEIDIPLEKLSRQDQDWVKDNQ